MTQDADLELLREALRLRVEATSVRQVASEVKMSHGAIHNLVAGGAVPRGRTLTKLRTWYLGLSAGGGEAGLTVDAGRFLIDQLLAGVPEYLRPGAGVELLNKAEEIYRQHGVSLPAWLGALRSMLAR